ncbi:hypothetical protein YT03_001064 [Salmonella enterica subsp. enterica]|nr:hypothetical protein [Salmonella enterica subsp. enterica serovar Sandiego]
MGYISQFEASDIDSDDIDLRFEVDGVETGTTVSIVDECGHAAQIITALLDELEKEKGYASTYEAEKWHYHGLAESEGERADRTEKQVDELTMWVKRLAHSLRNAVPNSKLHGAAMDYLSRKGLISVEDVLR